MLETFNALPGDKWHDPKSKLISQVIEGEDEYGDFTATSVLPMSVGNPNEEVSTHNTPTSIQEIEHFLAQELAIPDDSLAMRMAHTKKGDLNPRVISNTTMSIAIGPLVAFGNHWSRDGLGWSCALALIFVVNIVGENRPRQTAKSFEGSVHFFGDTADTDRREWIAEMRGKGCRVLQLPSAAAVVALDHADDTKLASYGLID